MLRNTFVMAESMSFPKAFWLYGVGFLTCLYLAAFTLVYTPWGKTFGLSVPLELLYAKIALVTLVCLWLIRRIYRVISVASESYEGSRTYVRCAKSFVIAISTLLFVATPFLALLSGVSYRG